MHIIKKIKQLHFLVQIQSIGSVGLF